VLFALLTPRAASASGIAGLDAQGSNSAKALEVPPEGVLTQLQPAVLAYYELDLAGNVRRLRGRDGADLGGYRYSAFGKTLEDTVVRAPVPTSIIGAPEQPLRWKGMWRFDVNGTELYDARARLWAPELGTFLSIDEFQYANRTTTLWGWPGQSPVRYADPSGRCGWVCAGIAVVAVGVAYGYIFASDDAATQRAAHPEATANPALGLALSVGVLAPASIVAEVGSLGSAVGAAPLAGAGALGNSSQSCSAKAGSVADVVKASGNSIRGAVGQVNKAGLSQKDAIDAIQQVVTNKGAALGQSFSSHSVQLPNGAVAVVGGAIDATAPVAGAPIVYVDANGAATFAQATISVSDIVFR
jgi:RHS repeat-associated protein